MAAARIEHEQETGSGWEFSIRLEQGVDSPPLLVQLTLSWADYDHWSSGTEAPSAVALQVLEFVLRHRSACSLPGRFDAATVRRWLPAIDAALGRAR